MVLSKVNAALKFVSFFARVRKIKYLNKPEENKPTQPIITDPASEKGSVLK